MGGGLLVLIFGLFGLTVGSFLNVLIVRHGARSLAGRSACMSCGRTIEWHDLVPVVSWLALRGRCRYCRSRISIQYPLVEVATGILFAFVGASPAPLIARVLGLFIAALLVAITVYDLRHTIIPDGWVYAFALLALASSLLSLGANGREVLIVLLSGPLLAAPLAALWFFSRGTWMGLGDAKLALGIGWLLGWYWGTIAIFLAFMLGALIAVGVLLPPPYILRTLHSIGITSLGLARRGYTMKSEVPFGPFLIASCLFVWFMTLYVIPIPLPW